jgi:hypothetical protein
LACPQQIEGNKFGQFGNGETRKQRRDQGVDIGHPQWPDRRDGRAIACLIRKAPDIALGPVRTAKTVMSGEVLWMPGTATARKIGRRCDDEAPNGGKPFGDQRGIFQHRNAQRCIKAAADQVNLFVARMQIDGDVGIATEEVGQDIYDLSSCWPCSWAPRHLRGLSRSDLVPWPDPVVLASRLARQLSRLDPPWRATPSDGWR